MLSVGVSRDLLLCWYQGPSYIRRYSTYPPSLGACVLEHHGRGNRLSHFPFRQHGGFRATDGPHGPCNMWVSTNSRRIGCVVWSGNSACTYSSNRSGWMGSSRMSRMWACGNPRFCHSTCSTCGSCRVRTRALHTTLQEIERYTHRVNSRPHVSEDTSLPQVC